MGRSQDFKNSVIYHIRCIETKRVIYVGSTTNFEQRKRSHKNVCCNANNQKDYNCPIYCYIRDNGGFECFEVLPVSFFNLENKVQLMIDEQNEMDKYDKLFNKYHSFPTIQHKKELKKKHNKEYHQKHIVEIKLQKKKYMEENKEEIATKHKIWRDDNKEKIFAPLECPNCKCITSKKHINRHQKSQKCLNFRK
jgi:hypothetical protein